MQAPTFSVILPTYRRPHQLAHCLKSLQTQDFSKADYEVIVVNDGPMPEGIDPITGHVDGIECIRVSQNHRGAAAARNVGASFANGRFLAFTDDDCRPVSHWLSTLERHMMNTEEPVMVGGKVVNELEHDVFASASQALIDFLYDYFNRDHQHATLLTSNNFCVPADAFRAIGGFDESFSGAGGEDREFCLRWARAGHRLVYAPEATVYHAHEMTLTKFLRQHLAYGRGSAMLRRRSIDRGYGPFAFEPVSFYWNLLRYPQHAPKIAKRKLCSALFAVSQLATGLGFIHGQLQKRSG